MKVGGLAARLAVTLALLALLTGGGLLSAAAAAALLGAWVPAPRLSDAMWRVLHIAAVIASALAFASAGSREGLGLLVAWLLVHRAWTGTTAEDARVALLLSTLVVLLACLKGQGLLLGGLLLAFAATLPGALMRATVGSAGLGGRGWLAGAAVVGFGTVLFFVLPRLHAGYSGPGGGIGGGGLTVVLGDESGGEEELIVARVRVTADDGAPITPDAYLRGRVLDHFDGREWTSTRNEPVADSLVARGPVRKRADIQVLTRPGRLLYGPPGTVGFDLPAGSVWRDSNDTWHDRSTGPRSEYTALVGAFPTTEPPLLGADGRADWLQLPAVDPRVTALAWSIAPGATDARELAQALTDALSANYIYVTTPPSPGSDPVATFLFETRRGHCEYFATALTLLLRERGVPARLATGFYSDELDAETHERVFRSANAHAWAEVPLASGWTAFDPTPAGDSGREGPDAWQRWSSAVDDAWVRLFVNYDLSDQFAGLETLGRTVSAWTGQPDPAVPARAGFGVALALLFGLYALGILAQLLANRVLVLPDRRAQDPLSREVARARSLVAQRGWPLPDGLPILSAAEWLIEKAGPAAEPLRDLAWLTYRVRYAPPGADPRRDAEALREARRLLRALRELPRYEPGTQ